MENTLLILGAGASKAVNRCFPTGFELLQNIHSHIFNDVNDEIFGSPYVSDLTNMLSSILKPQTSNYIDELKIYKKKLYNYVSGYEVQFLRNVMTRSISIDDFTSKYSDYPFFSIISKYATAHMLKGAENAYYESTDKKQKDWINIFLEKFITNYFDLQNMSTRLQIVSFNYDRLFMYLFDDYVKQHRSVLNNSASNFEPPKIIYPYGSLGNFQDIPFETPNNDKKKMESAYNRFDLLERKDIRWSCNDKFDTIVFIGFGFDKINFDNLNLRQFNNCKILSSYYEEGVPEHHRKTLETIFKKDSIRYHRKIEELIGEIQ